MIVTAIRFNHNQHMSNASQASQLNSKLEKTLIMIRFGFESQIYD